MFHLRHFKSFIKSILIISILTGLNVKVSAQVESLRGFTNDQVASQKKREITFQATPDPKNLREYMQTISSEPHHAGSPGSKKVAEFILSKKIYR